MESVTTIESVGEAHVVTLRGEIDAYSAPSPAATTFARLIEERAPPSS